MRKDNKIKGVFMKNTCLGLLILLGTALGAEIGGNSLVQTSENNYVTRNSFLFFSK